MARIRSIKPDFFTSETIARLPISARLTFIGLWTHVDDNGVCRANELLIAAALYPLDGMEGIQRTQEDLRRLSGESLVSLYEYDGKRYLWVPSWDEHQKVNHPGKPRFPRPDKDDCKLVNWDDSEPREQFQKVSGDSQETLSPEQGAGSRVKGSRAKPKTAPPEADAAESADTTETARKDGPDGALAEAIAKRFYDHVKGVCNFLAVKGVVLKAIKSGATERRVVDALYAIDKANKPITADTMRAQLAKTSNGGRGPDAGSTIPSGRLDATPENWGL